MCMATFIKTGFWKNKLKGYKNWLNLDSFVEGKIPPAPLKYRSIIKNDGNFSADVIYNNLTIDTDWTQTFTGTITIKIVAPVGSKVFCSHTRINETNSVSMSYTHDGTTLNVSVASFNNSSGSHNINGSFLNAFIGIEVYLP